MVSHCLGEFIFRCLQLAQTVLFAFSFLSQARPLVYRASFKKTPTPVRDFHLPPRHKEQREASLCLRAPRPGCWRDPHALVRRLCAHRCAVKDEVYVSQQDANRMLDGTLRRAGLTEVCRAHFIIWVLSLTIAVFKCAAVRSSS